MATTADFSVPSNWRKSCHSSQDGACVEVASDPRGVSARDSKNLPGPVRTYDANAWRVFTVKIKNGWQPS
jgi:hypothetical protein